MRQLIRYTSHLLLGAILGMIFVALSHSSQVVKATPNSNINSLGCPLVPELTRELLEQHASLLLIGTKRAQQSLETRLQSACVLFGR